MFDALLWVQNDRAFEFLSVISLGVSVASGAAWFASRHLNNAALRHLVLFSALISCFAIPAIASVCASAELTFVAIPIPGAEEQGTEPQQSGTSPACACATTCESSASRCSHLDLSLDPRVAAFLNITASPAGFAAETRSEIEETPSVTSATTIVSLRRIVTMGLVIWAVGTLLRLAGFMCHCGCVVQLRRSSRPVELERCQTLLREVTDQLGVRNVPVLLVSRRLISPLAAGLGRPAVILPERLLTAITDDELRDVLAHEVAHLRRGDQRIVLLQELAAALYWPIVFVHGLNRELGRTREELCDNLVLASRDAISYSETLYRVAELLVQHRAARGAVSMFGSPGELERRIAGLIDPNRNSSTVISRTSACVIACLFVAASLTMAGTRFAKSSEPLSVSPAMTERVSPAQPAGTTGTELEGDLSAIACCPS